MVAFLNMGVYDLDREPERKPARNHVLLSMSTCLTDSQSVEMVI